MKKYFLKPLGILLSIMLLIILGLVTALFFKPELVINTKTLKYALDKTSIFKTYSWDKGDLDIRWNSWNNRNFSGDLRNLCFKYESSTLHASSCIKELSWDLNLTWSFADGFAINSIKPVNLISELFSVETFEGTEKKEETGPPPIWKYWTLLWSDVVPDMNIDVAEINIKTDKSKEPFSFNISLNKTKNNLTVNTMDLRLQADPEKIVVIGPEKYPLPGEFRLKKALELENLKLVAKMREEGIPVSLSGNLKGITLNISSFIDLPLKSDFNSLPFRKSTMLKTQGRIFISDLKKVVHTYAPPPYDELPAPLNVMNGEIEFLLDTSSLAGESVLIETDTKIDLEGKKQALALTLAADIPLNVLDMSRGLIQVGIDFSKVVIQLPRLSKKSPPPQFFPDGRFKSSKEANQAKKKDTSNKSEIAFDVEALNDKALHVRSNLLDEPLRLNFDLKVRDGEVKDGFVKVLPLKTTIFKRPIRVRDLVIKFNPPLDPVIESVIKFPLPEYKITLKLEGPVSDPRYTFSSDPPLPKNDIYAVLLFGRPLADLGPDDKNAARETNKILAQGILSLSVLYFLSGSPVEYIGYDPDTGRATAQVGIDSKTSVRVGAGEGGGSTGVRRSLGKGWYLDTTVQRNQNPSSDDVRDYGVLLERIIAY